MRKAFTSRNKEKTNVFKLLLPILLFAMIAIVVVVGVQNVSSSSGSEQLVVMEQAVRRSVVQSYAIEGRYPNSLEYLERNYGLILDRDRFVYHYRVNGTNLLPEIAVLKKN